MKKDIFSVATTLTKDLVDEVIRLSDLHHKTSDRLFKAQVPRRKRKPFYKAADWVWAQEAASNLPKVGLEDFLSTLTHRQRIELLALTWLGRGDGQPGTVRQSYKALRRYAKQIYDPNGDMGYLILKPLGRYLSIAKRLAPNDIVIDEVEMEVRLGL